MNKTQVPNSDSRDNLIKKGYETLKLYFEVYYEINRIIEQSLFGREDSEEYELALRRFIRSSAAYISFLINIQVYLVSFI